MMNRQFRKITRIPIRNVAFKFKDRLLGNLIAADGLTRSEATAAFNLLNKEGDTLSTKELSAIFGFGNQKEAAVMERFLKIAIRKQLDIEGDVNMTFEEFYELIGGDRESGLQGIALAFENFDTDGDGKITVAELQEWLFRHGKHITTEKLEEMLECVDVNGDHQIDYDEFLILVTKKLILATVENYFRD